MDSSIQGVALRRISTDMLYPDEESDSDEEYPAQERFLRINRRANRLSEDRTLSKFVGLWRTIILSSLNKTLYPYSRYIRALNLRDLNLLLTDGFLTGGPRR